MSIATELDRIIQAKDDIKTSIENKGITVPSNALISDYSTYVDSIPTGSGITMKDYMEDSIVTLDLTDTGVLRIKNYAFYKSATLQTIILPDSVYFVGSYAFNSCVGVESVIIGNGCTSLDNYSFAGCSSMLTFVIGNGLTEIKQSAFLNCSSLQSITIYATTPPTLASYIAFNNTANCPIYVPAGSVDTYKAATNWKNSKIIDRIQAIPT